MHNCSFGENARVRDNVLFREVVLDKSIFDKNATQNIIICPTISHESPRAIANKTKALGARGIKVETKPKGQKRAYFFCTTGV